jgi:hypothetical protein
MGGPGIEGGCYCGAVRYLATGETKYRAMCHCANCRRAAGAQSVAWITVSAAGFSFTRGEPVRFRTDTQADRTHCAVCGTSLTYRTDSRPDDIDITTGSLDHPEEFAPTSSVHEKERLPWVSAWH